MLKISEILALLKSDLKAAGINPQKYFIEDAPFITRPPSPMKSFCQNCGAFTSHWQRGPEWLCWECEVVPILNKALGTCHNT